MREGGGVCVCCAGEKTAEDAEEGGVGLGGGLCVAEGWTRRRQACSVGGRRSVFCRGECGGGEKGGEGLLDGGTEGGNNAGSVDGVGCVCCGEGGIEISDRGGCVSDEAN